MDTKNPIAAHLGQDFAAAFPVAVRQAAQVSDVGMERAWTNVAAEFSRWMSREGARTSLVDNRLHVLELAARLLGRNDLHTHPAVVDAVLDGSGVAAVGDRTRLGVIVRRSLTDRHGILFTTRRTDGTLVTEEWFG